MLEALKGTTSKEEKALLTEWSKADKFKNLNETYEQKAKERDDKLV